MSDQSRGFVDQSLATCYNYIHTGRGNKAIKVMAVIKQIEPNNPMVTRLLDLMYTPCLPKDEPSEVTDFFGHYWEGQSLDGKSIEVFCDQGMGDTINMLRYLYVMKHNWDCKIVLNNYSYYFQFKDFLGQLDGIIEFTNEHVKCDYHTNIFSIPALVNKLEYSVYYPAHFLDLLTKTDIPPQPELSPIKEVTTKPERPCAGVSWTSNPENVLSKKKSVPDEVIDLLHDVKGWNFVSLRPDKGIFDFTQPLLSLDDTAAIISTMDVVISVDTVVLHLAGSMGKPTFGLLPFEADPRWKKCGNGEKTSIWYPSVRMFRQEKEGDWNHPIKRIKEELASLS